MSKLGLLRWKIEIVKSYLLNRTFKLKSEEAKSTERATIAQIPKGSDPGLLLYNIYALDISKPRRKCHLAQLCTYMEECKVEWQEKLMNWFRKISEDKTTRIIFSKKSKREVKNT